MKVKIGPYKKDGSSRESIVEINSSDDLYSLDFTLAIIIHPSLIAFKKNKSDYPSSLNSEKEWDDILDKMIYAFEQYINGSSVWDIDPKTQEGLELFGQWYSSLWW